MGPQLTEFSLKYRWQVILLAFLSVFAIAYGAKNLALSTDYRDFFSEDNPQLLAFENLQDTYTKSDNVLIIVTAKDGNVFTNKTLDSLLWLTEEVTQTPYSIRIDSITNFQHTKAFGDDIEVADLVQSADLSPAELDEIKAIALAEPALKNRLINADGSITGINITVQLPGKSLSETPEIAHFIRGVVTELKDRDANLDVHLTGIVMMNNAFNEAGQADASTLTPLMFLVVIVTLGVLLRSISLTILSVVLFMLSAAAAMGAAGWMNIRLEPVTISAPTIILTMAVADAVHLLSTYLVELHQNGKNKIDAMRESLRVNLMPLFITSATTALGFLSMNFSEVPPLNHLGNMVAFGVMVAFLLTITFLPAAVIALPYNVGFKISSKRSYLGAFADFVISKHRILLIAMLAVSAILISQVPKNQINDEFVKYFDPSVQFRVDTEYAAEELVGPYTIEFSVESGEESGITNPAYLEAVERFVEHLYTYDKTIHVFTLNDTFKQLNKNMHGDDPAWYKLPDSQELAAQYLLLYEFSLPYGLDLNNQIDVNKSATRITLSTKNVSTKDVLDFEKSILEWSEKNTPELNIVVSSANVIFAHTGVRNAQSLTFGATMALILISMILIVALRSTKIGLLSLIPNLVPAGIAFGIWALIDGMVGMSVAIVAGMTLGIVVDDSVHFLSKYLRARREKGYDAPDAIRYAFTHVGNALLITTTVLVIGFCVLTFSTFKMNADMGLVTAITLATALIVDFLLLPPLLMLFDKGSSKEKAAVASSLNENAQSTV